MKPDIIQPIVACRPYLPQDKTFLLEIARQTWDGNDYLPFVLDGWINDTSGWIFCAILQGVTVGMIRLSHLSDTQWWLEGLRVDPAVKGKKIGQHLFTYALNFWQTRYQGVIRLLTHDTNLVSQHIAEVNNFCLRTSLDLYEAPPLFEEVDLLKPADVSDLDQIFDWLTELEKHPWLIPYLDYGWVLNSPEKAMIRDLILENKVWVSLAKHAVLILQPEFSPDYPVSFIQAIQPGQLKLENILQNARRILAKMGWGKLSWMAPVQNDINTAVIQAGFVKIPNERVRLYEYDPKPESDLFIP